MAQLLGDNKLNKLGGVLFPILASKEEKERAKKQQLRGRRINRERQKKADEERERRAAFVRQQTRPRPKKEPTPGTRPIKPAEDIIREQAEREEERQEAGRIGLSRSQKKQEEMRISRERRGPISQPSPRR